MVSFYVLTFVPLITKRYDVEESFVIKHKLCNGRLTQQQSDAIESLNKPYIVPKLVKNPMYMHLH